MNFLKKYKKQFYIFTFFICIIIAIFSINRSAPTFIEQKLSFIITPFQKINTTFSSWVKGKYDLYLNFKEIEKENESLKQELKSKDESLIRLKQLEIENEKLQELLEMSSRYSQYEKVAANIISKDPSNWYNSFVIDKGSHDGIKQGMVVISSQGLIGVIKECGSNYSKVTSIIDDVNSISSKILRTEDIGFVQGNLYNKGTLKMEYIDSDAELIEGDEVVTSHLSSTYPPGIPIGYVKEITMDKNNISKTATIIPYTDFKHLENVLVIITDFYNIEDDNL